MGRALTCSVRSMTLADVAEVAGMEAAHQPSPWSEGVFTDELAAPGRTYLLAEEGQRIVGFGGIMVMGEEAHVTNLLVDEAARHRGIGQMLMVELVEAALLMGARHLTLEVRSGNTAARSLYSHFGLAPVGARAGYYRDDSALILWVHDIDSDDYRRLLDNLRMGMSVRSDEEDPR